MEEHTKGGACWRCAYAEWYTLLRLEYPLSIWSFASFECSAGPRGAGFVEDTEAGDAEAVENNEGSIEPDGAPVEPDNDDDCEDEESEEIAEPIGTSETGPLQPHPILKQEQADAQGLIGAGRSWILPPFWKKCHRKGDEILRRDETLLIAVFLTAETGSESKENATGEMYSCANFPVNSSMQLYADFANLIGEDVSTSPVSSAGVEEVWEPLNDRFDIFLARQTSNYVRQTSKNRSLDKDVSIVEEFPNEPQQRRQYLIGPEDASFGAGKFKGRARIGLSGDSRIPGPQDIQMAPFTAGESRGQNQRH
ncbi:hypothetical protein HWI79_2575 [Cryptosporidium felis]|nr:hypothetical protein HWI79_2575 [Cryptosporidium felis]